MPHPLHLSVTDLACRRGERVLFSGFNLQLGKGEAVQVAGANGRGKTTLLRTLAGLTRPQRGTVCWQGVDIHEAPAGYAGRLLYLAHENALNPDLTPLENLAMLQRLHGGRGSCEQALRALGVHAARHRICRRLSAGQRRRVALARLWLSAARLWLLDEPAAALDTQGRACLGELMARHVGAGGSVIYTTHETLELPGLDVRRMELPA